MLKWVTFILKSQMNLSSFFGGYLLGSKLPMATCHYEKVSKFGTLGFLCKKNIELIFKFDGSFKNSSKR